MGYISEETADQLADLIKNDNRIKHTNNYFYAGFGACLLALQEETPEAFVNSYLAYCGAAEEVAAKRPYTGPFLGYEKATKIGSFLSTNEEIAATGDDRFFAGFMAGIYSQAEEKPRPIEKAYLRYFEIAVIADIMKEIRNEY